LTIYEIILSDTKNKKVGRMEFIEKITRIHTIYPDLKIKILSFSRKNNMTEEKNG